MARPIKPPTEQLTFRGNFRATEAEGNQLEQAAAAAGLTVSDYVRGLVVGAKPRAMKATPERAALIMALGPLGFIRSDMIHVRADINQMLKDRWAYKFVQPERVEAAFAAIEAALAKIEALSDQIHNNLENDR